MAELYKLAFRPTREKKFLALIGLCDVLKHQVIVATLIGPK